MIFFRLFTALQTLLYRLSGGKIGGSMFDFDVLLLTTTGRKSGKNRTTPLGFFERDGGYVIVGSNGGSNRHPAWYHNLKSKPEAIVEIYDRRLPVKAEILTGEARAQAWQQVITASPRYAGYQKRTTREIPLVLLRPAQ